MATAKVSKFLRRLTRGMAAELLGAQTDRQLVEQLLVAHNETAFEALVRRHGPMVYRVCWRVLQHAQDAEDAFQATFLLLARQVRSIRKPESLASWLHGVAYRIALKARAQRTARARRAQRFVANRVSPPDEVSWGEVRSVIDEELQSLPEKWRAPLILCYLEGKTQEEAAAQLGWSKSAFGRRVLEARDALGLRLVRRGVALSAALGGPLLSDCVASAALAADLVSLTVDAATSVAAGGAATSVVSAKVAALTEGVSRTMLLSKSKVTVAMLLVSALSVGIALVPSMCAEPAKPAIALAKSAQPKTGGEKKAQPAPQPAGPGTLLLAGEGGTLAALTPDGKALKELNTPDDPRSTFVARLSPDGKRAAFVICEAPGRGPGDDLNAPWPMQLVIRKLGATEAKVVDLPGFGLDVSWSPDGKRLIVTRLGRNGPQETVLLDADTAKTEPLALPAGVRVRDWSPDGKTFLVLYHKDRKYRLGLAQSGDNEPRELTELKARFPNNALARFSPDGKKVLFTDADPVQQDAYKWHMSSKPHVVDVTTRKSEPLAEFPENAQCLSVAWSPDAKRIAYTWVQLHPEVLKKDMLSAGETEGIQTETFLIVADADGKNAKTVASASANTALAASLGSIDWR